MQFVTVSLGLGFRRNTHDVPAMAEGGWYFRGVNILWANYFPTGSVVSWGFRGRQQDWCCGWGCTEITSLGMSCISSIMGGEVLGEAHLGAQNSRAASDALLTLGFNFFIYIMRDLNSDYCGWSELFPLYIFQWTLFKPAMWILQLSIHLVLLISLPMDGIAGSWLRFLDLDLDICTTQLHLFHGLAR